MPLLLSPAGSPAALKSAINAGADEVYLGGSDFNARMNASNFDRNALVKAGRLCRSSNVGLHITLNTLIYDREFASVLEYVDFLANDVRPDALIVQDFGLACAIRKKFPALALHASTQMRIHSYLDAEFLKLMGFTRAVLARELPKEDIEKFVKTGLETEIFAHGAICVSESGGCLMSSVIGGRSGNRGECAQPCRLPYKAQNRFPLSLKDMCLAGHIKEISDIGVTSIKIEGRMKSPEYVGIVTSIYRRLIDENRNANQNEIKLLSDAFSRSGFTDGYFVSKINKDMFGVRREEDKKTSQNLSFRPPIAPIRPKREKAEPNAFILPERDETKTYPPSKQKGFVFRFEGELPSKRFFEKHFDSVARIDVPLAFVDDEQLKDLYGKVSVVLPRNIFAHEIERIKTCLRNAFDLGVRHATISSLNQIKLCEGFYLHGDYSLNVVNRETLAFLEKHSLSSVMLSPETDGKFVRQSRCALEYIGYGRTPLMHTRTCIIANIKGCPLAEKNISKANENKKLCFAELTDRTGARFPVIGSPNHTNTIYNSLVGYRLDKKAQLKKSGVGLITLFFTTESESEMERVLSLAELGETPDFNYKKKKKKNPPANGSGFCCLDYSNQSLSGRIALSPLPEPMEGKRVS